MRHCLEYLNIEIVEQIADELLLEIIKSGCSER